MCLKKGASMEDDDSLIMCDSCDEWCSYGELCSCCLDGDEEW